MNEYLIQPKERDKADIAVNKKQYKQIAYNIEKCPQHFYNTFTANVKR